MQYQGYGNGFKLGKISKVSEKSIWVNWVKPVHNLPTSFDKIKISLKSYNQIYKGCDIRFIAVTDWWLKIPFMINEDKFYFQSESELIRLKKNENSNPSIVSKIIAWAKAGPVEKLI